MLAFAEQRHGYPMTMACGEWKEGRSDAQNRYLFGVCYPLLAQAKGYTVNAIHEWMCGEYFGWEERKCPKTPHNMTGLESVPIRTTTRPKKMTVDQFCLFVEMVQRIGAQAGVFIPDPEPSDMQQSKRQGSTTTTTSRKASA